MQPPPVRGNLTAMPALDDDRALVNTKGMTHVHMTSANTGNHAHSRFPMRPGKPLSQEAQLLLYALEQQATNGACKTSKPGGWGWGEFPGETRANRFSRRLKSGSPKP